MLGHVRHDQLLVLLPIGLGGVKLIVRNGSPRHPTLSGAVDQTGVQLTEGLVRVVVEASAHTDACGPGLDVANVLVGVVVVAHVKADEIVELETLCPMLTQSPEKIVGANVVDAH